MIPNGPIRMLLGNIPCFQEDSSLQLSFGKCHHLEIQKTGKKFLSRKKKNFLMLALMFVSMFIGSQEAFAQLECCEEHGDHNHVSRLVLRYVGPNSPATITVSTNHDGDQTNYSGSHSFNELILIEAVDRFGTNTDFSVGGTSFELHTSCSSGGIDVGQGISINGDLVNNPDPNASNVVFIIEGIATPDGCEQGEQEAEYIEALPDVGTITQCSNNPITINLLANDTDSNYPSNSLTVSLIGSGAYGTFVNNNNGTVTYTPNGDFWSQEEISYQVCNPDNKCDNATITISGDNDINISGNVFQDINADMNYDPSETGQGGVAVILYEDVNGDMMVDAGDIPVSFTTTSPDGSYTFTLNTGPSPGGNGGVNNLAISSSSNDSYQKSDGNNYPSAYESGSITHRGYRFVNLNIPAGATINSASLHLTGYDGDGVTAVVKAVASGTPSSFSSSSNHLSSLPVTSSSVNWAIPNVSNGTNLTSPNLAALIQEVINGNNGATHISLIVQTPPFTGASALELWNYDDGSNYAAKRPKFSISWTLPGDPVGYVIQIDETSLPAGANLTTDNLEVAVINALGDLDCNNDFGFYPCPANAGTLTADELESCAGSIISATPNGDQVVPANYEVLYVLTSGAGLVVQETSLTPFFSVNDQGNYTIHTLVAEINDPNSPDYLNPILIVPGVTTGFDVNALLLQGGGSICGSLDVSGAAITVLSATHPDCFVCSAGDDAPNLIKN